LDGLAQRWVFPALVLGLVVLLQLAGGRRMNEPGSVLTAEALIQAARAQPAKMFPLETFQSYPIPVRERGTLLVLFLYGPQQARPMKTDLTVPTHVARIDARTGRLMSIRRFEPAAFGLEMVPGSPLGTDTLPPGISTQEYRAQRERLLQAYDVLLPTFAGTRGMSSEVRPAAGEFLALFPLVAEGPMLPVYRGVASDFFEWMASLVK